MLDPIRVTISSLMESVGKPEKLTLVRIVQLIVLILGLFTFGQQFTIEGVAFALNIMTLVGIGLLLWLVKPFVDYSLRRLFLIPFVALVVGLSLCLIVLKFVTLDWLVSFLISIFFISVYSMILYLFEGKIIFELIILMIDPISWFNRFKIFFSPRNLKW
jgi:hypothetical protein